MGIETIGQRLRPDHGAVAVAVPGTAVQFSATAAPFYSLYVKALATNAGNLYLGDADVDRATSQQITLEPGDVVTITPPHGNRCDLRDWYLDGDNALDGVTYLIVA